MDTQQVTQIRTDGPFIKKFQHNGYYYIYDVTTNRVIEVEQPLYDIIDDYRQTNYHEVESKSKEKYAVSKINESFREIRDAIKEHGFFSNSRPQRITLGISRAEHVKKLHENGLNQMLLELTRSCNLNCMYCQTSGKYSRRNGPGQDMSEETWKKALDFFIEKSQNSQAAFITFYGGEPLLRFDMIKKTVEYTGNRKDSGRFHFNITTNGTLLTIEIIDFLVRHDIHLLVSLDGPESVHDRYRVTREGKGSFNLLKKNLEKIKAKYYDYFCRNVSISTVLSPPFDKIKETLEFFSNEDLFKEIRAKGKIGASLVTTADSTFLEDFGLEEQIKEYDKVTDSFIQRFKKAILAHDISDLTIEKRMMDSLLFNLVHRPTTKLRDHIPPLGACHIGLKRLFVSVNGIFHICERSGEDYKIGCIDHGFDYDQIASYYRKLDDALADCKNCWAISLCERCWVLLGNIDKFSGKRKEAFCASSKRFIEKGLKIYTELLQEDPDCFTVFK